jgi:hypothetical protein
MKRVGHGSREDGEHVKRMAHSQRARRGWAGSGMWRSAALIKGGGPASRDGKAAERPVRARRACVKHVGHGRRARQGQVGGSARGGQGVDCARRGWRAGVEGRGGRAAAGDRDGELGDENRLRSTLISLGGTKLHSLV